MMTSSKSAYWITLEEARENSHGKVEWWKIEGLNGEVVQEKQHLPGGPVDRPVRLGENGQMNIGGCKKLLLDIPYQRHKLAVRCLANGRVIVGHCEDGKFSGPGKRLWLPSSYVWENNTYSKSVIKASPSNKKIGLPFIYLGNFKQNKKDDKHATVILKDGTTRIGPWKHNKPVGDWWEDHEKSTTGPEKLAKLLSIGRHTQASGERSYSTSASMQENGKDEEEQISSITKSLTEEAIGYDADPVQMEEYAQELTDDELHSVHMIQDACTPEDIESFQWKKWLDDFSRQVQGEKGRA
jgi:hypothetical protein